MDWTISIEDARPADSLDLPAGRRRHAGHAGRDQATARRGHRVEPGPLRQAVQELIRALNHLEYGDGNPTLKTLESVFKVSGMRISLAMVAGPADTQ